MRQEALVIEGGRQARVMVMRTSACTGDCGHCGGCDTPRPLYADADNEIGAEKGQTVYVETSTAVVLFSAVLVYLLPLVLFLCGYFALKALGLSERAAVVCAVIPALISLLSAGYYNKKRSAHPACTIVAVRENREEG